MAAANLHARHEGVKPGMRLAEATALLEAEVREHDSLEDIEVLCQLAERAQQFSPLVGLEQLGRKTWAGRNLKQPECLLLDITGLANLFGGEQNLVDAIAKWLHEQRYFACLALASSVGAAWALANYGLREKTADSETPDVPLCRKLIAPAGYDPIAIDGLPLAALRLPADVTESLRRLGVYAIGQLGALPRDGLATRLGQELLDRWDNALGEKDEAIRNLHHAPDWCLEQSLEYPTTHHATLVELVDRHMQELAKRLQDRGQGALRIVCRLDLVEEAPLVLQLSLFRPTNDPEHLVQLLAGQLEQQLSRKSLAPVWRLSVQVTLIAPLMWRQADLFSMSEAQNRNEMARLVDNLAARLGRKQVLSPSLRRESQPELAYEARPMTGRKQDGQEQSTVKRLSSRIARRRAEPSPEDPLRRPTQMYKRPIPVEVVQGSAKPEEQETASALPVQVRYQAIWYKVLQAVGPERLESGWWRGPSVRRDYYRIEVEHGNWWWIYRELRSEEWFLHGAFD